MDSLQQRVFEQMALERKELKDDQARLSRRRVVLGGQSARILMHAQKTVDSMVDDAAVVDGERTVARFAQLDRRVRELAAINQRAAENARALKLLDRSGEPGRRVRAAKRLGGTDEPMIGKQAAEAVLLHEGKPMRIEEITRRALEVGVVRLPGATPVQSMSSYLSRAAKKGDTFVRVGPGTYDLRGRDGQAVAPTTSQGRLE